MQLTFGGEFWTFLAIVLIAVTTECLSRFFIQLGIGEQAQYLHWSSLQDTKCIAIWL
jgi:hypothetical protein